MSDTLLRMWERTKKEILLRTTRMNKEFWEKGVAQLAARYNLTRLAKVFMVNK